MLSELGWRSQSQCGRIGLQMKPIELGGRLGRWSSGRGPLPVLLAARLRRQPPRWRKTATATRPHPPDQAAQDRPGPPASQDHILLVQKERYFSGTWVNWLGACPCAISYRAALCGDQGTAHTAACGR